MANIEERLIELINAASLEQDDANKKVQYWFHIKEMALNQKQTNRLLDNFFHDILAPIALLTFNPQGSRLVTGGPSIEVWETNDSSHNKDDDDNNNSQNSNENNLTTKRGPERIWTCPSVRHVDYLKYSPDGTLFCTASRSDKRVKVWFEVSDRQFSFIYLNHPAPVSGLEWRRTSSSYEVVKTFITASRGIANVLITSCQDNKVRVWLQTLPLGRGQALVHFHLAGVIEAESAHWVNNKESLLQDLLARTLKNHEPESLVDQFDSILESTLKEWRSVPDLIFCINKSDGTLNACQLKYLDGEETGLYRQMQTNAVSCIRMALPLHDATTLSSNVTTYSQSGEQSNIFMLTQHMSGTLGLWKLNLDSGVDLVTRITGLPISPQWLKDGLLGIEYDNDETKLTTHWTSDGPEPVDVEEIKTFDGESNLFKASRLASNIKILPQYHLKQLVELLAFGKLQRVKAILNHLVNCLSSSEKEERKTTHRSRTLSIVTQSQPSFQESLDLDNPNSPLEQPIIQEIELDYIEVTSIKPLSLYLLLESDTEKPNSGDGKIHRAHEEFSATFDSIIPARSQVEETLDEILGKSTLDTINKQKELKKLASVEQGKGSLTNFNPRKAKMLTKILTHTHLPGLTNVDQMHLLAVADALAFFDASPDDLNELHEEDEANESSLHGAGGAGGGGGGGMSIISTNIAIDSLDDRGLRFLTAMRQYVYLTKYLPMNQRAELREQGIGNHNLVWAFHSETQEELIGLIPCVQRKKPNWLELREFGIGWWVKKLEELRKLIEKVAQSAYQAKQDPLDAALFYLAMKKKTLVCALLRRSNCDKRLLKLFEQDFNDPVNRKKALKNAYALLGLHRFEHAAAFFLLAGSIWDAVEVCINNLNDIQLAMVLIRLYDNDPNVPSNLRRLLFTEILGSKRPTEQQQQQQANSGSTTSPATPQSPTGSMTIKSMLNSQFAAGTLQQQQQQLQQAGTDRRSSNAASTAANQYCYDSRRAHQDPFLRSMAFWRLGDYLSAVHTLLEEQEDITGAGDSNVSASVFNFYRFLKDQPLVSKHKHQLMEELEIKRRTSPIEEEQLHFHRARSLSSGQLGFEGVRRSSSAMKQSSTEYEVLNETTHLVDKYSDEAVAEKERRLFFSTAQTYLDSGCPLLALEVLCSEDHLNMSQAQRMKFIACLHILLNELNTLAQDHIVQPDTCRDDHDDDEGDAHAGVQKQKFNEIFVEWLERNIEALRKICSFWGSEEPILHTMLTYCSLHIAAEESLNTVRLQLLHKLSLTSVESTNAADLGQVVGQTEASAVAAAPNEINKQT